MNQEEQAEARELLTKLSSVFNRPISEAAAKVWIDCLDGKTANEIANASKRFFAEWHGFGFPKPSDFLQYIESRTRLAVDFIELQGINSKYSDLPKDEFDRLNQKKRGEFLNRFRGTDAN